MSFEMRLMSAAKFAGWHFVFSLPVAIISAAIVLVVFYPYPYREISGGFQLFLLIFCVDVVCGPLLTFVLFNPQKSRREIRLDITLVMVIQFGALVYGVWVSYTARPLFLVMEVDRFKVIASVDFYPESMRKLPPELTPQIFSGVKPVALRPPRTIEEKNQVLFESINGGRDYAERPEFYLPYNNENALKSLEKAKDLSSFFERYPQQRSIGEAIASEKKARIQDWKYLPVVGRQDWIALLDEKGIIQGFLKGDGF